MKHQSYTTRLTSLREPGGDLETGCDDDGMSLEVQCDACDRGTRVLSLWAFICTMLEGTALSGLASEEQLDIKSKHMRRRKC